MGRSLMLAGRSIPVLVAGALLFAGPGSSAQTKSLRVCVQQLNGDSDTPDNPQILAVSLAKELSGRELSDGETVQTVVIPEKTEKAVKARVEQEDCTYLVRIWHHSHLETQSDTDVSRDMDTLVFDVRDLGSKRLVVSGQARPLTIYAKQGHREYIPYPDIAKQITTKLNRTH